MRILEWEDWSHISLVPQVFIMETILLEMFVQSQNSHVHSCLQRSLWLSNGAFLLDAPTAEYREGELTAELKLELSKERVRNHLVTEKNANTCNVKSNLVNSFTWNKMWKGLFWWFCNSFLLWLFRQDLQADLRIISETTENKKRASLCHNNWILWDWNQISTPFYNCFKARS